MRDIVFLSVRWITLLFPKTEDFSSEDENCQHKMQDQVYAVSMRNRKMFIYVTLGHGWIPFIFELNVIDLSRTIQFWPVNLVGPTIFNSVFYIWWMDNGRSILLFYRGFAFFFTLNRRLASRGRGLSAPNVGSPVRGSYAYSQHVFLCNFVSRMNSIYFQVKCNRSVKADSVLFLTEIFRWSDYFIFVS